MKDQDYCSIISGQNEIISADVESYVGCNNEVKLTLHRSIWND